MKKYLLHFKTITKHKYYVAIECFKVGLYWQGIIHDLSKYSCTEFFISAKFYQGKSSPIEAEIIKNGYSLAWLNHKNKNKHHFQYWIHYNKGEIKPVDMPNKYILEMACDFIGAGKAYNNVSNDTSEPLKYWKEKIDKTFISEKTIYQFESILTQYANTGKLPKYKITF